MKAIVLATVAFCLFSLRANAGSTLGPRIPEEEFKPPRTAKVGERYTYAVRAEDPEGGELTYGLVFGPPAMVIDPKSGEIRWTPTPDDGSCTVTIEVTDGFAHRVVRSYGIIVSP